MSGKPQPQIIDFDDGTSADENLEDHIDLIPSEPHESIVNAADARRRLEDYWAQKALDEELKKIDDWEDPDSPSSGD